MISIRRRDCDSNCKKRKRDKQGGRVLISKCDYSCHPNRCRCGLCPQSHPKGCCCGKCGGRLPDPFDVLY